MEIPKVGLGAYDARHIQALRGEWARSIKPNTFQDASEAVQLALALAGIDIIELSDEAKLLLKKWRKAEGTNLEEINWLALLAELKRARNGSKSQTRADENSELNFVTLPIMLPPLPEVPPRDNKREKQRKASEESEIRRTLSAMIVRTSSPDVKARLIDELEPLKSYVINACKNFGVRVLLLGRKEKISDIRIHGMALSLKGERTRDGRLKDHVRGFYYEDRRLLILGEEQVGISGRFVSLHEFAHAYDHTFSEKHYQLHYLSTQLWNLFAATRKGLITDYAGTSPAEYFAESVEGYFLKDMREWLRRNDPQMHEFLRNLFL